MVTGKEEKTFFKCPKCGKEYRIVTVPKTCKSCYDKSGPNNPFYGKKHSEKTKKKIRESQMKDHNKVKERAKRASDMAIKRAKKLVIDGKRYESIQFAVEDLNIHENTIRYRTKSKNFPNYYFLEDLK